MVFPVKSVEEQRLETAQGDSQIPPHHAQGLRRVQRLVIIIGPHGRQGMCSHIVFDDGDYSVIRNRLEGFHLPHCSAQMPDAVGLGRHQKIHRAGFQHAHQAIVSRHLKIRRAGSIECVAVIAPDDFPAFARFFRCPAEIDQHIRDGVGIEAVVSDYRPVPFRVKQAVSALRTRKTLRNRRNPADFRIGIIPPDVFQKRLLSGSGIIEQPLVHISPADPFRGMPADDPVAGNPARIGGMLQILNAGGNSLAFILQRDFRGK